MRIRIQIQDPKNFHMDPDPDADPDLDLDLRRETLRKNYTKKFLNLIFQNDIKKSLKINKQTINLSIIKGILLLFLQFCFHPMNLYIS